MSVREKLKKLFGREITRSEYVARGVKCDSVLVVPKNENTFPFLLVVPEGCKMGQALVIEANNNETDNWKDLLRQAGDVAEVNVRNLIEERAPVFVPILPSFWGGAYYQQLARECFLKGARVENYDQKLLATIGKAREVAKEEFGLQFAEKLFVNGYSSSGVFAQRFALLHPEIVQGVCVGGAAGTIPLPSEEFGWPLGVRDYKELFGRDFDFDAYKKIKQTYYVAEFEGEVKSSERLNEDGERAPKHDMSYMARSVPECEGQLLRAKFGKDMIARALNQMKFLQGLGIDVDFEVVQGRWHNNNPSGKGILPEEMAVFEKRAYAGAKKLEKELGVEK